MKNVHNNSQQVTSTTFLPPIENPEDLMMKMAYDITLQQFGKVLTPLKVVYARMQPEFGQFSARIR
jgi:hypothetical protein